MESLNVSSSAELKPMLIILGGLPGTGKSTIGKELARRLAATYLRIDSIEQALRDAATEKVLIKEEGYCVAFAVAEDNLRLGQTVIADSVNPVQQSRDAWMAVAQRASGRAIEVEIICSDPQLHRRRVETRATDIPGLQLPPWDRVLSREYDPWLREHTVIDTAGRTVTECVEDLRAILSGPRGGSAGEASTAMKG